MKQFPKLNCRYGAPMGRNEYGSPSLEDKCRLFKVVLNSGGYDDGGAYWGIRKPGESLYCLQAPITYNEKTKTEAGDGVQRFYSAKSRKHAYALALQDFEECRLKNGYFLPDSRYSLDLEYCGQPEKRHVFRFCGESKAAYVLQNDGFLAIWDDWLERQ